LIERRDSVKAEEVMDDGLKERLEFLQKNNLLLNEKLNRIESNKQDLKLKYQEERKHLESQIKELKTKTKGLTNTQYKIEEEVKLTLEDLNEKLSLKETSAIGFKKNLAELEKEKHGLQTQTRQLDNELEELHQADKERDICIEDLQRHIEQMSKVLLDSNTYLGELSQATCDKNNLDWLFTNGDMKQIKVRNN